MQTFVVVVTGAGTGIGRATARAFADGGARVVAVGRRVGPLEETAAGNTLITPLAVDITEADGPKRIAEAVGGRLDVLVNNAGINRSAGLGEVAADDVAAQWATNVVAPLRLTQVLLSRLAAARGVVVNVTTSVGQRGWAGNSVYVATKAALESLTRSWAVELAGRGIRVVAVAPGAVATPIGEHQGLSPERSAAVRAWQIAHTPLGRVGRPEEVAWMITRLASADASFVTGTVVAVDGGAVVA